MRSRQVALLVALVLSFGASLALSGGAGADEPKPEFGMAGKRTVTVDVAGYAKQHGPFSSFECYALSGGANTKLDCDDPLPNNEPDIEVDPTAPGHMIASSNDYGTCCDEIYTTFDNGAKWANVNISRENPAVIGSDPVTAIDRKHGTAIHSSLNFNFSPGRRHFGLDRRRHQMVEAGYRRRRYRLRHVQDAALQRQRVDRDG
jgi:hypothetical protein